MDVHLRDLRYFVAVAEELNFQRAADRLFISQPLLNKQIRLLEAGLRTQLFERGWRTLTLTAAGRALLPVARDLVLSWDQAQRDTIATESAVLTIGISTSVGRGLLKCARERFQAYRPDWRLEFRQINWEDPTAGIAGKQVDVAFVWLPIPDQESFTLRVLATEARYVAMREDHRLAGRSEVTLAEIADEPFLALPLSAGPLRDHWLALDERDGRPPRIGATVSNAPETLTAVENGDGIVLLSAGNAAIYRRPGIVAIPVTDLAPCELAIAWRRDDERRVIRDFIDALTCQ
jgi:DNA-binding transcriptional LysR family regulator